MVTERGYSAVVYHTTTGRIFRELNLMEDPAWNMQLNAAGSDGLSVKMPLGQSDEQDNYLREWVPHRYRYSVAVLLGDQVLQAGPNVAYQPDEEPPDGGVAGVTVSCKGFWELLNRRVLHKSTWNPATTLLTSTSADVTWTDSLPNIAQLLAVECTSYANRLGSGLPLDIPAAGPVGTNTRTYHGYEMAYVGQRLQELTQVDQGPDIIFQPYLTTSGGARFIRHRMLIGNPYLIPPGNPLLFDYGSNMVKLAIAGADDDGGLTAFVKGTGNESGQLYGFAQDTALINQGWPMMDFVDSGHSSASEVSTLTGWAQADVALSRTIPEQWKATVLADASPRAGEYLPGHFVNYNVNGHHWIPDGSYVWRLLSIGRSGSTPRGTLEHIVQAANIIN